jgi:hypothetical protein
VAAVVAEVLAAVVAVAAGAAVVVVAAEGDNALRGGTVMKSTNYNLKRSTAALAVIALAVSCLLSPLGLRRSQAQTNFSHGTGFATPQEAVNALIEAAAQYDTTALGNILGPYSSEIIGTGEPARDKEMSAEFAAQARAKQNLVADPKHPGHMTLDVGSDDWAFPVPLVKLNGKWYFDTTAGRREIILRRVGRNELDAIEICRGYVEAQHEYALQKHGDSGVNQYAQRIISTPGKEDGLAWKNAEGAWDGPIGENVAKAIARGYTSRSEPYHGYFFQVLKGQGPAAPLGELDYVVKGIMIGGFALIASPAQYRVTGVKTFMVSQDGVVYQKDLGPNTLEIARGIDRFNPDKSWTPVLEDDQ